jgi:hypothetical protein
VIKSASAVVLSVILVVMASLTFAQSGSAGEFTIFNNTKNNIVISFYTNDGSGWSSNWLSEDLDPGEEAYASFYADESCEQLFQVGWLGENDSEVLDEPISIDVCDASNIYLDDNEIYYD